jgi:hypothetical protein
MKRLIIIIILAYFFLLGCNTSSKKLSSFHWNEQGFNNSNRLNVGIPAYAGVVVNYMSNGKNTLKVKLNEPIIISVASKPEKWGFFQFPSIYRSVDSTLVAKWNMASDAITSYGHRGDGYAVSKDGGKSWSQLQGTAPIGGGLVLSNKDEIKIYTPPALGIDTLHLPKPIANVPTGRKFTFYRLSELPPSLQGVYIQRLHKGEKQWSIEHDSLYDPDVARYSESGLFPVVWWGDMQIAEDGSAIAGTYPGFKIANNNKVSPSGVFFYRSTDEGHTWNVQGRIRYEPDVRLDPNGNKRVVLGFTEPAFAILSNGTFLCVMRTTDRLNSPMYLSHSNDRGVTWSKPRPFTQNGVLPRLLQLSNGVIVLSSGRPGVQLRFCLDGKGEKWTDPFDMLPYKKGEDAVSCGYTGIVATGPDRFLLIYSDFKYANKENEIRKAIKVREVVVSRN